MFEPLLGLGVTAAIIALGFFAARRVERQEPLLSVSRPVKILTLGLALTGPFVLQDRGLLPVAESSGWDLVAALALSLVLYLGAARLVGVGAVGSGAGGAEC